MFSRRVTPAWGILLSLWGLHSLAAPQQGAKERPNVRTLEEERRHCSVFTPPLIFFIYGKVASSSLILSLPKCCCTLLEWNTSRRHSAVTCHHRALSGFVHFLFTCLWRINFFSVVLLPHSGLSSPADSAVTTSLCTLTKGRRTWPETAAPAKEESPSGERRERYVRHCKLSKQGLYKTHPKAVQDQAKWVRYPR